MKLSTLLHRGADECLSANDPYDGFSCRAFWLAVDMAKSRGEISSTEWGILCDQFQRGMEALGLDWGSFHAFDDVHPSVRQAARYQWMKFCALLAEEQGL